MSALDRLALERALRGAGVPSALRTTAIHNVRLHLGATEVYGRDEWIGLEARRAAAWGVGTVEEGEQLEAPIGQAGSLLAVHWRLGNGAGAAAMAVLSIVRDGRIVREWQYLDSRSLPLVARGLAEPMWRVGVAAEYGESRAVAGQLNVTPATDRVAPRAIAADPLVQHWHRLWNLERRWPISAIALLEEPVMYCERLVRQGERAALQWRLLGRRRPGMTAAAVRIEVAGLSFFERAGDSITHCGDYFDPS